MTVLLAFYHTIGDILQDTDKFDDEILKNIMIKEQLFLLLSIHKKFVDDNAIEVPLYDKDKLAEYRMLWNEMNMEQEPRYQEILAELMGDNDDCGFYI